MEISLLIFYEKRQSLIDFEQFIFSSCLDFFYFRFIPMEDVGFQAGFL